VCPKNVATCEDPHYLIAGNPFKATACRKGIRMPQTSYGAVWYRCDLHCHTPFDSTKRFGEDCRGAITAHGNGRGEALQAIVYRWLDTASERADVIAVTDHNSVDGYGLVQRYLPLWREQTEKNLSILPGMEVTCGGERNLHLLVIAAQDTPAGHLDELLTVLFEGTSRHSGNQPQTCGRSLHDVASKVQNFAEQKGFEYLLVPAHITGHSGIERETYSVAAWDQELRNQIRARTFASRHWAGFHAPSNWAQKQGVLELLTRWGAAANGRNFDDLTPGERASIRGRDRWPVVQASDPNNYDGLCTRFSWLKMEKPTLEGIRQALLDPSSRLRTQDEGAPPKPETHICSLRVAGSLFLKSDFHVAFHPNLTTIIGGRGTGKSTVLEMLRYGLHRDDQDRDFGSGSSGSFAEHQRIRGSLDTPHAVSVSVSDAGRSYSLVRPPQPHAVGPDPLSLIKPRILSQRQIGEIALDPKAQRRELDGLIEASRWTAILDRLSHARTSVEDALRTVSRAQDEATGLPGARTELEKAQARINLIEDGENQEVFRRYSALEAERTWVTTVQGIADDIAIQMEELASTASAAVLPAIPSESPSVLVGSLDGGVRSAVNDLQTTLTNQAAILRSAATVPTRQEHDNWQAAVDWQAAIESVQTEYEALAEKLAAEGTSIEQHQLLKQEEERLIGRIETLTTKELEATAAQESLYDAIIELAAAVSSRSEERRRAADTILATGVIRVFVEPQADLSPFRAEFNKWQGTGLRGSDWDVLLEYISDAEAGIPGPTEWGVPTGRVDPPSTTALRWSSLAVMLWTDVEAAAAGAWDKDRSRTRQLIGNERSERLSQHFDRAIERAGQRGCGAQNIAVPHLSAVPDDLLRSEVRRGEGWQPIEQGSLGERSVGILSLLLSTGTHPLIVDQPEEDLDNRYVYENVVEILRKRKFDRQIILVTHNANIPVNGDAELVLSIQVDESQRADIAVSGTVDSKSVKDELCEVMEGGAEAFRLRKMKYGY